MLWLFYSTNKRNTNSRFGLFSNINVSLDTIVLKIGIGNCETKATKEGNDNGQSLDETSTILDDRCLMLSEIPTISGSSNASSSLVAYIGTNSSSCSMFRTDWWQGSLGRPLNSTLTSCWSAP